MHKRAGTCPFGFQRTSVTTNPSSASVMEADEHHDVSRHHEVAIGTQRRRNRVQRILGHVHPDERGSHGLRCPGPAIEDAQAYNSHHHHYLTFLHEKYGDIVATTRGDKPVVFVRSPDAVRKVLDSESFGKTWDSGEASGDTNVDYVMNLIQPFMKKSVFNMHGEANFRRRMLLRPCFTAIKQFVPLVAATTDAEVGHWTAGLVDIQDLSHEVLRKNILAVMCGSLAHHMHYCLPVCHEVMEYFVRRYAPACHDQTVTEQDNIMMQRLNGVALRVARDLRHRIDTATSPLDETVSRSLLGLLIDAGVDDEELSNTFVNVMVAAGEAPASALAQTLEELAHNQPVLERLRAEAAEVLAGGVTERYDGLELTENCVAEGLRLFAPATLVSRTALVDTVLDGVQVPKGTSAGVCVHSVHHDEKQWPDPHRFNPDRVGLDYEAGFKGFLSFSNGQRGCPGKHLAVMICKISLAMIVARFDLQAVANQPRSQECEKVRKFVEWSVNGIPLQLQQR